MNQLAARILEQQLAAQGENVMSDSLLGGSEVWPWKLLKVALTIRLEFVATLKSGTGLMLCPLQLTTTAD